jgi:hypothetical protein
MIEVRRVGDNELCGYVDHVGGKWQAMTIFRGHLGTHDRRDQAEGQVLGVGLGSLAERWTLIDGTTGEEQIVRIQQASPSSVTLALGYYSLPGVPTRTIARSDLASGRWELHRR